MVSAAVRVDGLRELERAFRLAGVGLDRALPEVIESAGEPVRAAAQNLAVANIRKIGVPWSRMRVGVSRRVGFVAPVERGRNTKSNPISRQRYSRPKFKGLLLARAMEPALDANINKVEDVFEDALADLARAWSRV